MVYIKNCMALVAGVVSLVVASPHGHQARAVHRKKDITDVVPAVSEWFREGVLNGLNPTTGPIAMDNDQGAYVVDFFNTNQDCDVDLVMWSSTGQNGTWTALTVNVHQANITTTIPAGGNLSVSFNPSLYTTDNGFPDAAGSISGAWCPMYKDTPVSSFGGCDNTWGEFTFAHDSYYSTLDVSRLVNMNGNTMVINTFPEKGSPQACLSDMETCVYKCADGSATCDAGECSACSGKTGCMGMNSGSGYAAVYLS